MSLTAAIFLVVAGLGLLAFGGEVLVRGAVATARRLNVSTAVIGLTIVAMATSLPELAVSLMAAVRGSPDVAVGNVVGSNIFNLAVILGLTAVVFPPLRFRARLIRFDVVVMVASAGLAILLTRDHSVGRLEGIVFMVLLAGFLAYRASGARVLDATVDEVEIESELHGAATASVANGLLRILAGAALLTLGAEVLVRGAVTIAEIAGLSERVIAITLVSAGTGLPELATAVMAGRRGHTSVAVGNVIGSNIFNVFAILGTVAIVRPPIAVSPEIAGRDMWWMLGFCLVALVPVLHAGRRISRVEGLVALGIYALYLTTLL